MNNSGNPILNQILTLISTKHFNLKGRRVIGSSDAQDLQDCVTLNDLNTRLAPSAYTDTTNAENMITGILPNKRLPSPSAVLLGGVKALAAVSHKFLTSIGTDGSVTQAQPAFTDISGTASTSQVPTSIRAVSAQNVVTGSRTLGTVYQNTAVTPLFVVATVFVQGTTGQIQAFTDTSNPPTTMVAQAITTSAGTQIYVPLTFIVLPNSYYKLVLAGGTGSINTVTEWS